MSAEFKITRDFIFAGQSRRGGWSRAQIEEIGVSWPLREGWIDFIVGEFINKEQAARFIELKDFHLPPVSVVEETSELLGILRKEILA